MIVFPVVKIMLVPELFINELYNVCEPLIISDHEKCAANNTGSMQVVDQ